MQDNPFNLLVAFFGGATVAALFILCMARCFCSRENKRPAPTRSTRSSQRTQPGVEGHQYELARSQSPPLDSSSIQVMFFPDKFLPCKFYRHVLINGANRCTCDRRRFPDKVHFGDGKTTLIKLWECLVRAKRIDLCIYRFTLFDTAHLLIDLNKRPGSRVRIITDQGRSEGDHDQIPVLQAAGIEVREKERKNPKDTHLMHHKFVILDDKIVFNGSFNWTHNAVIHNNESLIKISVQSEVDKFRQEFDKIWHDLDRNPQHMVQIPL